MRHCWGWIAFLALGTAAGAESKPARLVVGEQSIEELLRLPADLQPGHYTVNCEGRIRLTGFADPFECYAEPAVPISLSKAVADAGRRARFMPATREGERIEVFMLSSTLVYVGKGGPFVLTVPNNGPDRQRYGLLYSSPQSTIESRLRRPILARGRGFAGARELQVWLVVEVDATGRITGRSIRNDSNERSHNIDELERYIERLEFVPGQRDGKPVAATYVESIYSLGLRSLGR